MLDTDCSGEVSYIEFCVSVGIGMLETWDAHSFSMMFDGFLWILGFQGGVPCLLTPRKLVYALKEVNRDPEGRRSEANTWAASGSGIPSCCKAW